MTGHSKVYFTPHFLCPPGCYFLFLSFLIVERGSHSLFSPLVLCWSTARVVTFDVLQFQFLYSTMDLVFVCELDGFQHGPGQFALKRAVILPVQGGSPTTFTFATDFLFQEPETAQQTFRYATRHLHGLPLAMPGLNYESRVDALTCYFKGRVYGFQEQTGDYTHQPPTVLVLCKGEQKCQFSRLWLSQRFLIGGMPFVHWCPCRCFCRLAKRPFP